MIKGGLVYNRAQITDTQDLVRKGGDSPPDFNLPTGTLSQAQASSSAIDTTSLVWLPFLECWAFPGPPPALTGHDPYSCLSSFSIFEVTKQTWGTSLSCLNERLGNFTVIHRGCKRSANTTQGTVLQASTFLCRHCISQAAA